MLKLSGTGASNGIAIGELYMLRGEKMRIEPKAIADAAPEISRYKKAKHIAIQQLAELYTEALGTVGEKDALVFEIHQMMLDDDAYGQAITDIITAQSVCAEYAVSVVAEGFARVFAEMDDPYMRARAADIRDISDRLIGVLSGRSDSGLKLDHPVIIFADDLSPSQTIRLDRKNVLAFITRGGARSSHTAILARTMGIPAVIGLGDALPDDADGKLAVANGETGEVIIRPDDVTLLSAKQAQCEAKHRAKLLLTLKGVPAVTKCGKRVLTSANIGGISDLQLALDNDAEGIGLFRTEFLYLESDDYPDEQKQFAAYKSVIEAMKGKRVVMRTLDIGADKRISYFGLQKEENPAMGLRAIRVCLTRQEIFKTQLRAMYRASAFGKAALLFPMIVSLEEWRQIKEIAAEVTDGLKNERIPFDESLELGVMIETPAAALISDELAKEVDFFSIGTNDLSQYTLAIDRQNEGVHRFFNPHHPAVMRLIHMTAGNAHKNGITVCVCGELAADLTLTEQFVEMGIDELSVAAPSVLPLREKICGI